MTNDTLHYSIIDLTGNNGLGEVMVKKQFIGVPNTVSITAVRHRNNKDYWIMVNDYTSKLFDAYLLTENGLSPTPVRSGTGMQVGWGNFRFSPDGKRMAAPVSKDFKLYIGLYDFDNSTGLLSNEKLIKLSFYAPQYDYEQLEFSPDSRLLYIVYERSGNCVPVTQYQVNLPDTAQIRQSKYTLGQCTDRYLKIRLGPDGRMYLTNKPNGAYISVIQSPNQIGAACGYTRAVYYPPNPGLFQETHPNTISNTLFALPALNYSDSCATDTIQFWASSTGCTAYHRWNFGDPGSGAANTAEGKYPRHLFSGPGTYTVRCITELDTLYTTVNVAGPLASALPADTTLCAGQPLHATGSPGSTWQWAETGTPLLYPQQSGLYQAEGSNPCSTIGHQVQVTVVPELNRPFAAADTVGCGASELQLAARNPGSHYLWSTGQTTPQITVYSDGLYWVQVSNSCFALTDSVRVRLRQPGQGPTHVNVFTPNGDGLNDELQLFQGEAEDFELEIFSRWGRRVWHSSQPGQTWAGTGAEPGLYYYSLRFRDCTGQLVQRKGSVSLMR